MIPSIRIILHHHPMQRLLVAASPLALAPVGLSAEILSRTAEVASTAAESIATLLVDDRSASLTLSRDTLLGSGLGRELLVVALSESGLASITTVQVLVLDVVLGTTVSCGRAAAVEETVGTGSRASDTALGVAADVDLGNSSREGGSGRGSLLCDADLHSCWSSRLAGRLSAGEGVEAGFGVAVVDSGSAPSILAA
jgi:hypothetical protein